jgi:hypothetical protein
MDFWVSSSGCLALHFGQSCPRVQISLGISKDTSRCLLRAERRRMQCERFVFLFSNGGLINFLDRTARRSLTTRIAILGGARSSPQHDIGLLFEHNRKNFGFRVCVKRESTFSTSLIIFLDQLISSSSQLYLQAISSVVWASRNHCITASSSLKQLQHPAALQHQLQ